MSSKYTAHNDARRNRYLFDFESIVDLKISYLKEYYIKKGNIISDFQLNPFKFKRMYDTNDVLIGIADKDTDLSHPSCPVFTSMKTLIENCLKGTDMIDISILCKDRYQERIINENIKQKGYKILIADRSKVKTNNFARIVLADARQVFEFRNPVTVDFMILNFRENFQKDNMELLDKDILIKIGDINRFTIANAYPEIKIPVG